MNVEIKNKTIIPATEVRPVREDVEDGDIRMIIQDGVYEGWYKPAEA